MDMFTTLDKIWFGICGIIVAICLSWLTYVYMEYRVVGMQNVDYSDIPTWSWKPVFTKVGGSDG